MSLFQPSHEEHQQWYHNKHDMKAAAEIYLLSLTDKIVTSAWSTFGYVGYALGGLRPYLMFIPENQTAPDPPCTRAMSMEPCNLTPPLGVECRGKPVDKEDLARHLRVCEDSNDSVKFFD